MEGIGTEHTLYVQDDLLLTYRRVGYNDCIEMVEMGKWSRWGQTCAITLEKEMVWWKMDFKSNRCCMTDK